MENIDVGQGRRKHLKVGGGGRLWGALFEWKRAPKNFFREMLATGRRRPSQKIFRTYQKLFRRYHFFPKRKKIFRHTRKFSGNIIFFPRKLKTFSGHNIILPKNNKIF
jgi:hypothetical protein